MFGQSKSVENVRVQWCCTDPRYLMITGMYAHMIHYNDLNTKGHRGIYRISRIGMEQAPYRWEFIEKVNRQSLEPDPTGMRDQLFQTASGPIPPWERNRNGPLEEQRTFLDLHKELDKQRVYYISQYRKMRLEHKHTKDQEMTPREWQDYIAEKAIVNSENDLLWAEHEERSMRTQGLFWAQPREQYETQEDTEREPYKIL